MRIFSYVYKENNKMLQNKKIDHLARRIINSHLKNNEPQ
jgi:hypothetical protein